MVQHLQVCHDVVSRPRIHSVKSMSQSWRPHRLHHTHKDVPLHITRNDVTIVRCQNTLLQALDVLLVFLILPRQAEVMMKTHRKQVERPYTTRWQVAARVGSCKRDYSASRRTVLLEDHLIAAKSIALVGSRDPRISLHVHRRCVMSAGDTQTFHMARWKACSDTGDSTISICYRRVKATGAFHARRPSHPSFTARSRRFRQARHGRVEIKTIGRILKRSGATVASRRHQQSHQAPTVG